MKKTAIYDFTQLSVETDIDSFVQFDGSKAIGNAIHRSTSDIGMDDIARRIYHEGRAELSPEQANAVNMMVQNSNLVIALKQAVSKLFTNK